ncbi:MAG: tRNA 2-thiocytidine(32) synthetase TtcA [Oligoflexales bacterium]
MDHLSDIIRKKVTSALNDYQMIAENDRILCAVSGGKDSTILALMLDHIKRKSKISFSFESVILDQKQPGFQVDKYGSWLSSKGIKLHVIEEDTYSIVTDKVPEKKTFCGLCSRLRRGILYNYAHAHGFTKIALGHHRDDLNETVLMNMLLNGRIASMSPKLQSDDKRNIVIRPLSYVPEKALSDYAEQLAIPVIPCNLCGSQDNMMRQKIKSLIKDLEVVNPGVGASLLTAQKNIRPSQLADINFLKTF